MKNIIKEEIKEHKLMPIIVKVANFILAFLILTLLAMSCSAMF